MAPAERKPSLELPPLCSLGSGGAARRSSSSSGKPGAAHQQLPRSSTMAQDEHLFNTPGDLVCPITLSLFRDPVCNAAGQVYERGALQRHLLQAAVSGQPATDPVSNAVLPSLDLVPVWPMRSRAAEYRASAARECVQRAAAPGCADPVTYLRRAAELVLSGAPDAGAGAGLAPPAAPAVPLSASASSGSSSGSGGASIPGMSLDFARYVAAHHGRQYDALLLKYFGNELLRGGAPDAASDVFYRLLLGADGREQQAEYLQLCLDCWTGGGGAADDERQADQQQQAAPAAAVAPASAAIVAKLADFVQRQHAVSPGAIVSMLQSTHHGAAMARRLCQVLLARAAAAAAAAEQGAPGPAALGLPGGLGAALELLVALVELGQGALEEQLAALAAQLAALQQQADAAAGPQAAGASQDAPAAAGAAGAGGVASSSGGSAPNAAAGPAKAGARGRRRRGGASWRGGKGAGVVLGRLGRLAAAGALAAASLAGGNHPLLRLARIGPLLYLLRTGL